MWAGKAVIRPGWAVFLGTAGDNRLHRHHAVQVATGLVEAVELCTVGRAALVASGAVIPADLPHQLASSASPVALFYLERESKAGRNLDAWCEGRARSLTEAQSREVGSLLAGTAEIGQQTIERILAAILSNPGGNARTTLSDERITRSISALPRPLPETITLAATATDAGLSASRYAHLFRSHTGLPFRPYLRWLRLQEALAEVARGGTLTAAAFAAGFSDSAHLSRTFRRTFGIAPSTLLHPAMTLEATKL